jgi:hypothetical protein
MLKFFHPSIPICEQSTSRVKNYKLEGWVLIENDKKKIGWRNKHWMGTSCVVENWLKLCSSGGKKG